MNKFKTGITCETFYNRMCRCHDYTENKGYLKRVSLFFCKLLKESDNKHFLENFSKKLNGSTFTGERSVLNSDISNVRSFYTLCAKNINNLLKKYKLLNLNDEYVYKYMIKGSIGGIMKLVNKDINIQFSYKNALDTQKMLDFYDINNYFYNISNKHNNDSIVMSVPTNVFFSMPYETSNYTMRRGLTTIIKKSKIKKCGDYCITCINDCKPTILTGLNRLEMTL